MGWDKVPLTFWEAMGAISATTAEMAVQLEIQYGIKISDSGIRDFWSRHPEARDAYKKGQEHARLSLRRRLWQMALGDPEQGIKPDKACLIFLAKQPPEKGGLGFTDQIEQRITVSLDEAVAQNPVLSEIVKEVRKHVELKLLRGNKQRAAG